jgi:hypothetical protein
LPAQPAASTLRHGARMPDGVRVRARARSRSLTSAPRTTGRPRVRVLYPIYQAWLVTSPKMPSCAQRSRQMQMARRDPRRGSQQRQLLLIASCCCAVVALVQPSIARARITPPDARKAVASNVQRSTHPTRETKRPLRRLRKWGNPAASRAPASRVCRAIVRRRFCSLRSAPPLGSAGSGACISGGATQLNLTKRGPSPDSHRRGSEDNRRVEDEGDGDESAREPWGCDDPDAGA